MKNSYLRYLVVAVAAALTLYDSVFIVNQHSRALVLQFGEVRGAEVGPGLHLKLPFVQTARKFDARLQPLDRAAQSYLSADQKQIQIDYFAKWRIADLAAFYRATGGQELSANDRLAAIIDHSLHQLIASSNLSDVAAADHDGILAGLKDASPAITALGVELVDVRIESVDLPDKIAEAYFERMRAQQLRLASDARARGSEDAEKMRAEADDRAQQVLADAYRDAERIRGEGDAKAAEIYARAYGQDPEFFRFYRSLSAYKEVFGADSHSVLVIEPKGEFFRYFGQADGGKKP